MFLFYVLSFFKKENTIQGGTLFKEIRYIINLILALFIKICILFIFRYTFWVKPRKMQRNLNLVLRRLKSSQAHENPSKSKKNPKTPKPSKEIKVSKSKKEQAKVKKSQTETLKNAENPKKELLLSNKVVSNNFGVSLIPPNLHEKLFGCQQQDSLLDEVTRKKAERHLYQCDIRFKDVPKIENVPHIPLIDSLDFSKDISAHFRDIGQKQVEPFLNGKYSV